MKLILLIKGGRGRGAKRGIKLPWNPAADSGFPAMGFEPTLRNGIVCDLRVGKESWECSVSLPEYISYIESNI